MKREFYGYINQKEFDECGEDSISSRHGTLLKRPIISKFPWKGNPVVGEKRYKITIEEAPNA